MSAEGVLGYSSGGLALQDEVPAMPTLPVGTLVEVYWPEGERRVRIEGGRGCRAIETVGGWVGRQLGEVAKEGGGTAGGGGGLLGAGVLGWGPREQTSPGGAFSAMPAIRLVSACGCGLVVEIWLAQLGGQGWTGSRDIAAPVFCGYGVPKESVQGSATHSVAMIVCPPKGWKVGVDRVAEMISRPSRSCLLVAHSSKICLACTPNPPEASTAKGTQPVRQDIAVQGLFCLSSAQAV
ncbi:hypothetical protein CYMTET_2981 [Cymbomonas tetramitiformis]|uniref:Uncharacterized protein n=1 Tax=Cymbomonas tetramitiformis TaxID=36881 RepID=A0AAE0H5Z5_9CHLO|nr:hypothetical protein CYMTET_2981 [Cymbomonas tetramitiformis]